MAPMNTYRAQKLNSYRLPAFISMLVAAFLMVMAFDIRAEEVDGLYDVSLPVDSQSNRDLIRATRKAFQTVIVRMSGNASALDNPVIKKTVKDAVDYAKSTSYVTLPVLNSDEEQLHLAVEFEPTLIEKALRDAGLPLWSSNRPSVLFWLVVEDGNGRRFANVDSDADLMEAVSANATRRGLAIMLPALDLEDTVAISVDDFWQLNLRKIKSAAQRYQADTLLVGRVSRLTSGNMLGKWVFEDSIQTTEFDGAGDNAYLYVGESFDRVADELAEQYAVAPVAAENAGVLLSLTGIENFQDYARVINYLQSVAAIRHANVISIDSDEVIVQLVADGEISQLQQFFQLDNKLQLKPRRPISEQYAIDLFYHWLR